MIMKMRDDNNRNNITELMMIINPMINNETNTIDDYSQHTLLLTITRHSKHDKCSWIELDLSNHDNKNNNIHTEDSNDEVEVSSDEGRIITENVSYNVDVVNNINVNIVNLNDYESNGREGEVDDQEDQDQEEQNENGNYNHDDYDDSHDSLSSFESFAELSFNDLILDSLRNVKKSRKHIKPTHTGRIITENENNEKNNRVNDTTKIVSDEVEVDNIIEIGEETVSQPKTAPLSVESSRKSNNQPITRRLLKMMTRFKKIKTKSSLLKSDNDDTMNTQRSAPPLTILPTPKEQDSTEASRSISDIKTPTVQQPPPPPPPPPTPPPTPPRLTRRRHFTQKTKSPITDDHAHDDSNKKKTKTKKKSNKRNKRARNKTKTKKKKMIGDEKVYRSSSSCNTGETSSDDDDLYGLSIISDHRGHMNGTRKSGNMKSHRLESDDNYNVDDDDDEEKKRKVGTTTRNIRDKKKKISSYKTSKKNKKTISSSFVHSCSSSDNNEGDEDVDVDVDVDDKVEEEKEKKLTENEQDDVTLLPTSARSTSIVATSSSTNWKVSTATIKSTIGRSSNNNNNIDVRKLTESENRRALIKKSLFAATTIDDNDHNHDNDYNGNSNKFGSCRSIKAYPIKRVLPKRTQSLRNHQNTTPLPPPPRKSKSNTIAAEDYDNNNTNGYKLGSSIIEAYTTKVGPPKRTQSLKTHQNNTNTSQQLLPSPPPRKIKSMACINPLSPPPPQKSKSMTYINPDGKSKPGPLVL